MSLLPNVCSFVPTLIPIVQYLHNRESEYCFIVGLDHKLQITSSHKISSDHTSQVVIRPRSILNTLVTETVEWLVLMHNHPSGLSFPSKADYTATFHLINLGSLLEFTILDHIIVTKENYFSFSEAGILADIKSQYV